MNTTIVISIVASLILMSQAVLAAESRADQAMDKTPQQAPASSSINTTDVASKYPIEIPPASELLSRFKEALRARPPAPAREPDSETPQLRLLRRLVGSGVPLVLPRQQCFRAIPTRDEFLQMVRKNPADANQILQRCNLDLRGISPLPQLPVGNRQLPVDTRQRPVGTWNN